MSYLFQLGGCGIRILDPDAEFILGYIVLPKGGHRVQSPDGSTVAIVEDLDEALSVLIDHHEKHPAQWEQESPTEFEKLTPFGLLSVGREPLGFWSVYRNLHTILLQDGKPAAFGTAEKAKEAADAHMGDELGKASKDGFAWLSMAA
jgi:hypothetical protein